ncbi:MAG: hypothetical protein KatS3mg032_2559 [Cyclobacteriaceae bacterium]|nr:MAG: hypothetical protein KatS3mg032_2559 [Cyclobacteriaceae bacterium]
MKKDICAVNVYGLARDVGVIMLLSGAAYLLVSTLTHMAA